MLGDWANLLGGGQRKGAKAPPKKCVKEKRGRRRCVWWGLVSEIVEYKGVKGTDFGEYVRVRSYPLGDDVPDSAGPVDNGEEHIVLRWVCRFCGGESRTLPRSDLLRIHATQRCPLRHVLEHVEKVAKQDGDEEGKSAKRRRMQPRDKDVIQVGSRELCCVCHWRQYVLWLRVATCSAAGKSWSFCDDHRVRGYLAASGADFPCSRRTVTRVWLPGVAPCHCHNQ